MSEKKNPAGQGGALGAVVNFVSESTALTEDSVRREAEAVALARVRANPPADPFDAAQQLVAHVTSVVAARRKDRGMVKLSGDVSFSPEQACQLAEIYLEIRLIATTEGARPMLAVYDEATGLYVDCGVDEDANAIVRFLRSLKTQVEVKWLAECMAILRARARRVRAESDPAVVALENGIFNMHTRTLQPFSPEVVLLAKARTRMPDAEPPLPVIDNGDGTIWDPKSWLLGTMGSVELADSIIELLAWCLRPRAFSDDKIVLLFSRSGSNGKGTLLKLFRAILGGPDGVGVRAISLETFGKDANSFLLGQMIGAVANLVDESNGVDYLDSCATLKVISSHDPIMINRKYLQPIEAELYVPMIFSMNQMPKTKEKSEALERRLHIVPFGSRFMAEGTPVAKNPRIKSDYILREEVREWFVWRALALGEFTELSRPVEVRTALDEYRGENVGPVSFWREYGPEFTASPLGFLPLKMLYAVYVAASRREGSKGTERFDNFVRQIADEAAADGWKIELDGNGRRKRYMNRWTVDSANHLRPLVRDLGVSTLPRNLTEFGMVPERMSGCKDVAAWTYNDSGHSGTEVARVTTVIPDRLDGLVRDAVPPAPPVAAPSPTPRQLPADVKARLAGTGPLDPPAAPGGAR